MPQRWRTNSRILRNLCAHTILLSCAFAAVYPLFGIMYGALQSSAVAAPGFGLRRDPAFTTLRRVWAEENFAQFLFSSTIVTAGVLAIATPLCVVSGYVIGALRPAVRGR